MNKIKTILLIITVFSVAIPVLAQFRTSLHFGWQPERHFTKDNFSPFVTGLEGGYEFELVGVAGMAVVDISTRLTQPNKSKNNPRGTSIAGEVILGPSIGPVRLFGGLRYEFGRWRLSKQIKETFEEDNYYEDPCGCYPPGSVWVVTERVTRKKAVQLQQPRSRDLFWQFSAGLEFRVGYRWRVGAKAYVDPTGESGRKKFDFRDAYDVRVYVAHVFGG